MRFYKTNSVHDGGVELSPPDVAAQFWASADGKVWATEGTTLLERTAVRWMEVTLGGWEPGPEYDAVMDAIHETIPR